MTFQSPVYKSTIRFAFSLFYLLIKTNKNKCHEFSSFCSYIFVLLIFQGSFFPGSSVRPATTLTFARTASTTRTTTSTASTGLRSREVPRSSPAVRAGMETLYRFISFLANFLLLFCRAGEPDNFFKLSILP